MTGNSMFTPLAQLPDGIRDIVVDICEASPERRAYAVNVSQLFEADAQDDPFSLPGKPRISAEITLLDQKRATVTNQEFWLVAALQELGQDRGMIVVTRAVAKSDEGSTADCRFAVGHSGENKTWPRNLPINKVFRAGTANERRNPVYRLLELGPDPTDQAIEDCIHEMKTYGVDVSKYTTVRETRDWVRFYNAHIRISNGYYNWVPVRLLNTASQNALVQAGHKLHSVEFTDRSGKTWPFLQLLGGGTVKSETAAPGVSFTEIMNGEEQQAETVAEAVVEPEAVG